MHVLRVEFQRLWIKKMTINMNIDKNIIQSILPSLSEVKEVILFYTNKVLLRLMITSQ